MGEMMRRLLGIVGVVSLLMWVAVVVAWPVSYVTG